MSTTIQELGASLQRLHANGHPAGLAPGKAESFTRALASGADFRQAAAQVRLDSRLVASVSQAGDVQIPAVLSQLVSTLSCTTAHTHTLQAAASYPLVLAASIACTAGIVFGVMGPAMTLLPLGRGTSAGSPLLVALAVSLVLLVGLSLTVLLKLPVPPFAQGWQRLEAFAFLDCMHVFVRAGVPLPKALRGASTWCRGSSRQRATDLARVMEAGGDAPDLTPLLDDFEGSLLVTAARSGTLDQALEALVEQRRIGLEREIPAQAMRIHLSALALAGASLLMVGGTFFATYYVAVAG